jgi:hypothetical protein
MNTPQMHPRNAGAENAGSGTLCRQCREPFAPKRPWQKFCTPACRRAHHAGGGMQRVDDLERRVTELERQMGEIILWAQTL